MLVSPYWHIIWHVYSYIQGLNQKIEVTVGIGKLQELKQGAQGGASRPENIWHIWFPAGYYKYSEKPFQKWFEASL